MTKTLYKKKKNAIYYVFKDWHKKKNLVTLYQYGLLPAKYFDYFSYFQYWDVIKEQKGAIEETAAEFNVTRKIIYIAIKTFLEK